MDKSSFLADIGKIVAGLKNVDAAYIFGSFLERGIQRYRYSIAPIRRTWPGLYKSLKFSLRAAGELERQIKPLFVFDVKILNSSPTYFQFEVIKKGQVIFSRDKSRRVDYEFEVISTYLDLKYMYDFFDKEFLAKAK